MHLVTIFYLRTQPQNVIVLTDDVHIARAAAKKYAQMNNRPLDHDFPGTSGHGVGAAAIESITGSMKKFVRINVKLP